MIGQEGPRATYWTPATTVGRLGGETGKGRQEKQRKESCSRGRDQKKLLSGRGAGKRVKVVVRKNMRDEYKSEVKFRREN